MGLMNCGDCNARVSSSAAACPRCNAPPSQFRPNSVRKARPYLIAIGSALAGAALTLGAIIAYGLHHALDAPPEDATADQVEANAAAREALRGHANFFIERRGEYGYRLAADTAGAHPMFIRYMGTGGRTTRFMEVRPDRTNVFTCEGMCDQVVIAVYVNGKPAAQQTVDVVGGSMLYAIIEDIIQGRVEPYQEPTP